MSVHPHNQTTPIELVPPITHIEPHASDSHPETTSIEMDTTVGHEPKASPENPEQSAFRADMTNDASQDEGDKGDRLSRSPSLRNQSVATHQPPSLPRSADVAFDRHEKRSPGEPAGSNAMLNLPPPLPFDLRVSNLWVGVPQSGPSRWV